MTRDVAGWSGVMVESGCHRRADVVHQFRRFRNDPHVGAGMVGVVLRLRPAVPASKTGFRPGLTSVSFSTFLSLSHIRLT